MPRAHPATNTCYPSPRVVQARQGQGGYASALGITPPECKAESNPESFLRHSLLGHLYEVCRDPEGMANPRKDRR